MNKKKKILIILALLMFSAGIFAGINAPKSHASTSDNISCVVAISALIILWSRILIPRIRNKIKNNKTK